MVRGIGLIRSTRDIGQVGIGHAIRFGMLGSNHEEDLVQDIVLMQKDESPGRVIQGVRQKIEKIQKLLRPEVEMRPYYSRDQLVKTTVTISLAAIGSLLITLAVIPALLIVVIGGLISSTALTLLVLSAIYALLARLQEPRERLTPEV